MLLITRGYVRVRHGLKLATGGVPGGKVLINGGGIRSFEGTQTFGPGTVEFGDGGTLAVDGAEATLTLGRNVLIHGKNGNIGPAVFDGTGTQTLINEGSIVADVAQGTLAINAAVFVNRGTLQEMNGGKIVVTAP